MPIPDPRVVSNTNILKFFIEYVFVSNCIILCSSQEAKEYLEKNKIGKLFEELGSALYLNRPSDPVDFLIEELNRIKACQEKNENVSNSI